MTDNNELLPLQAGEPIKSGIRDFQITEFDAAPAAPQGPIAPAAMWLYEHEDGRHIAAPADAAILAGDPQWVRVGPVEVHGVATDADALDACRAFVAWADRAGYDTARTYDTERSVWLFLNPMTADLWKAWQAACDHLLRGIIAAATQTLPTEDEGLLTVAYMNGFYDGKRAASLPAAADKRDKAPGRNGTFGSCAPDGGTPTL